MAELHNTVMGKRLIEHTLPEIARQLERIADALEQKKAEDQIDSRINSFKTYLLRLEVHPPFWERLAF